MPVDELEAFLGIFYPAKNVTRRAKSLRQNWKNWKRRYVRHAGTGGNQAQR